MKPLEILSALPQWAKASPDQILGSPAFSMPCRLGEESATMKLGAVEGGDTLDLAVLFGDEPHTLRLSRSPRFAELGKIWDARAEVPPAVLLALVETECGPLLQMLENAVRRQLRLVGIAEEAPGPDRRMLFAQVSDVVFALTLSDGVAAALGSLRNLDLASPALRGETLAAEVEHAAFALSAADMASLAEGDALLLPEISSVPPRLVADGRFVVDASGVSAFSDDGRCRVVEAEPRTVTLGELFDAAGGERPLEAGSGGGEAPIQLRLVQNGKLVASGRLGRIGDHPAFVVEARA